MKRSNTLSAKLVVVLSLIVFACTNVLFENMWDDVTGALRSNLQKFVSFDCLKIDKENAMRRYNS